MTHEPQGPGRRASTRPASDRRSCRPTRRPRSLTGSGCEKPGCDKLATQPKAGDFTGSARPAWMNKVNPPADAPVYMAAPGAMLYAHICVNCHGPKVDGKGLQADALAASSEGEARPANFREGLFGPSIRPGREPAVDLRRRGDVGDRAPLGVALHGVDGAGRHAQEDSAGHHPPGRSDEGVRAAATQPSLPARRREGVGKHAEARGRPVRHHPARPAQQPLLRVREVHRRLEPSFYPPFNANDTPLIDTHRRSRDVASHSARSTARPSSASTACRSFSTAREKHRRHRGALLRRRLSGRRADPRPGQGGSDRDSGPTRTSIRPASSRPPIPTRRRGSRERRSRRSSTCRTVPRRSSRTKSKVMWTRLFQTDDMKDNVARWSLRGGIATGMAVFSYLHSGGAQRHDQAVLQPVPASEVSAPALAVRGSRTRSNRSCRGRRPD